MSSKRQIAHTVSTVLPGGSTVGDEYYNPTTNSLYKVMAINGTSVEAHKIPQYETSGNLTITGSILPLSSITYDLGSPTIRWRNVYTGDLNLSNGIGDYSIVEGADDLFLYNNRTGKTFKFALIEVDPAIVPPRMSGEK